MCEDWIVDGEIEVVKVYRRQEDGTFPREADLSREAGHSLTTPLLPGFRSRSPSCSPEQGQSMPSAKGREPKALPFSVAVLALVRRIPPGRIATYGDVAAMAGRPRAARAVGNIMRGCRDTGVPCHRVVGAGGALGATAAISS